MDGVHDLGGMEGFGDVVREENEPVFHEQWESRVLGMALAFLPGAGVTIDEFRHAIERMDPAHYLGSGYYEHWLDALTRLGVEKGMLAPEELEARVREMAASRRKRPARARNPTFAEALAAGIRAGAPAARPAPAPPAFATGGAVRVRRMHPHGHTRCPRYVRGARGKIVLHHGAHVFPDASAHGDPKRAEHLYTVAFDAAELWGPEAEPGSVRIDLWEPYLEPA